MESIKYQYQKIKERIIEDVKEMPPKSRLLSRPELSKKYDVSRTTIDKAISELIGMGYLYALDGSGTYIAEPQVNPFSTLIDAGFQSWGVIVPDIQQDTYPGILRGIEDIANENRINTILCNSDNDIAKQNEYIKKLIQSKVSGIIIVPAVQQRPELGALRELEKSKIPFVFCNRAVEGIIAPKVLSNNFFGAYIATKHLLSNGYRRIAYITRIWYPVSLDRFQGYLAALIEHGYTPPETYYNFQGDENGVVDEQQAVRQLLSKHKEVDAVFCFNDSIAKNVFWELEEIGKKVGLDFGLVGYDNTRVCDRLPVKLTSVRFQTYEIGQQAAKLLLNMSNGRSVPNNYSHIIHPKLEVRESGLKSKI